MRMHVLDLGRLRLDKNFMVANAVVATQRNPNPQGRLIDIPVSAYLIEHPDGNVLFDTGCHPQWAGPDGRWPEHLQDALPVIGGEACMLPARLDALGIGPDQIRYVVLSHLHCDHAGCVEFFRKSELLVHEDEFSGALRRYALHDHSTPYVWKDIDRWTHLDLRWRLIGRREPDQTMVEGVRLLNFGSGHAHGMLGLQVALRSQPGVLLVSDACYTAENYGPPTRLPGFLHDSLGFMRTLERIRVLARESGASVWFGHDAAQFETLRKSTEGFYE
ncbi:MAG: N-acyl homoserine lactonase family protein [Rhodospirillaceae bacterium]|nr:N-acyl homoserine lactonase family protein [Rhodospirillaceae bacterium]